MTTYPLIAHRSPEQIVAYRNHQPIRAARFLADVAALAACLPAGSHVLNACADRYRFTVGMAAILLSGRVSLLPSTHTPEAIRQLQQFAPDAICLSDTAGPSQDGGSRAGDGDPAHARPVIDLPQFAYPAALDAPGDALASAPQSAASAAMAAAFVVPHIEAERTVAFVFTSGSTGVPVPHRKTWGSLVRNVHAAAATLGIDTPRLTTLVGTVPPQHMYGFESTVLLALLSGNAFHAGKPFYPADIVSALEHTPQPRVLVSTPVHLRSVLAAEMVLPHVELVLSATAPLSRTLAQQAEARFDAPLLEIYGSTETGQIATRRSALRDAWDLIGAVELTLHGETAWASGGHIDAPTPMGDLLEILPGGDRPGGSFLLHGRAGDIVNIAGKRSSIGYLNHQVNAIEGVLDAVFYMPDSDHADRVTRPCCFVVAPALSMASLVQQLRERIEPVFMPRPLVFVDSLPRNALGKLPRDTLRDMLAAHQAPARAPASAPQPVAAIMQRWTIAPDHPALAGHFPGYPVVPGVVLLDQALHAITQHYARPEGPCELAQVKWLSPVGPGEPLTVQHTPAAGGKIDFSVLAGERLVARGSASWPQPAQDLT